MQHFLGGGMSEVYCSRDTVLGRTVAVKLLTPKAAQDADTRARFLLEAQVSSSVVHENIITTYDYGEEDGIPYLVLEFLTGSTLKEYLAANPELPLRQRVSISLQVARALEYVHSRRFVHRDVKPDNVHVDKQGRVKLMDFGIVKTEDVTLTQAGFALGTPHYVAPELVLGQPVTPLVDVYSYGVLLFEILTGRRAIAADTVERIFYQILHEPISLDPLAEAGVPERLIAVVRAAIERDPAKRSQSMAEVAAELDAWLQGNPTQTNPTQAMPLPERRRVRLDNRLLGGAVALAAVAALGIGYLLVQSGKAEARLEEHPHLDDPAGDMVLIPAGSTRFGADNVRMPVPAFYLDLTEVTNEAYGAFCTATGRALPRDFAADQPGLPVVNVTMADAQAFARWAGKRLPTALEWERAARGEDGRPFPWGAAHKPQMANVRDNPERKRQKAVSADAYRTGRSPFGLYQMIGNVKEFTADRATPTALAIRAFATEEPTWHVVKGGSFASGLAEAVTFAIEPIPASYAAPDLGFRCARTP
ncbi:MAG: bifunctional serine/threonine-protein kinase/formylglycine-generating enzyme family protein [Acidobacteriota bacterium]